MSSPAGDSSTPDAGGSGGPRWPAVVGVSLCVAGMCVAAYLTYEHYTSSTSLSCPAGGGIVNCFKVTTSSYSMIHGVPVALLGLVFFAVMLPLQTTRAWDNPSPAVRFGRLGWSALGVLTILWLIRAEIKLDAICEWCTAVHVLTFALFVSTAFATAMTAGAGSPVDEDSVDEEPDGEDRGSFRSAGGPSGG